MAFHPGNTSRWCPELRRRRANIPSEARPTSASSQPFAGQIDHLAQSPAPRGRRRAQIRATAPIDWRNSHSRIGAEAGSIEGRACLSSLSSFWSHGFGLSARHWFDPIGSAPIGLGGVQRVGGSHSPELDPNMVRLFAHALAEGLVAHASNTSPGSLLHLSLAAVSYVGRTIRLQRPMPQRISLAGVF